MPENEPPIERRRRPVRDQEMAIADHRIVHPIDGIRWLHYARRVFLDENGKPSRGMGLSWDITGLPGCRALSYVAVAALNPEVGLGQRGSSQTGAGVPAGR